ncbi:MAG: alkaline phosphatase PhoX [Actinomycetota bacterium]
MTKTSSTRTVGRRDVLKAGLTAAVLGGTGFGSAAFPTLAGHVGSAAWANGMTFGVGLDPAGPEMALPPGFSYKTFGAFGSAMSDGFITPPIHDGMGTFQDGENVRIVRNHELGSGNDVFGPSVIGRRSTAYDRTAPGGTTTMIVDSDANLLESFVSLNGTDTNCSGAPTPWGTWLSCEETTIGTRRGKDREHGYVFEVDAFANSSQNYSPHKGLGRFVHEAAAVDEETGVVYLTEDNNPDGFYRFVPDTFGDLSSGVLQVLAIKGQPNYNTVRNQTVGVPLPVKWFTIDDPDPEDAERHARAVYAQGQAKGGARFLSGEGATYREGSCVFGSSDAGDLGLGQIWQYTPTDDAGSVGERGELELLFESPGRHFLDGPDNICTSPGGAIVVAEDGKENSSFMRALLPDGSMINLAQNLVGIRLSIIDASGKTYDPYVPDDDFTVADGLGYSEFAGPRFSPDGTWLFVNIQVPGITCAITGDWGSLGL